MSETIFMIHGMWGRSAQWDNYRTYFESRGYRCVTPNLRHHGGDPTAPPHPDLGTTSILDYAADLQAEVEALVEETGEAPILMGHSMGGLLAQMLAARLSGKAAPPLLVLLTPASPRGILAIKLSVIRGFFSGMTRWAFWRKPYRQTLGEAAYSTMHLLSEAQQKAEYAQFGYESGRAVGEIGFWLFDPHKASAVDPAQITSPVLVIAGAEDRITPASVVRQVARRYGADYHPLAGHAHWVLGEPGWEDVAGLAAGWLEKHLEKAPRAVATEATPLPPTPPA